MKVNYVWEGRDVHADLRYKDKCGFVWTVISFNFGDTRGMVFNRVVGGHLAQSVWLSDQEMAVLINSAGGVPAE